MPGMWTVVLPWGRLVNANQRDHWTVQRNLARTIRASACWCARRDHVPRLDRVRVVCELVFATHVKRDPANWAPSAKAAVDGLVDAGILPDDDAAHLDGPDMRLGPTQPDGVRPRGAGSYGQMRLHITDLNGAT